MSSIISDSLEFKWDTDHLNCGAEENNFHQPQQVIYQQQPTVCYSQPINNSDKKENSVIGIIRFIVVIAFVGLIAYFIFGGSPDVLVSYVNSGVSKISEVLSNVHF